MGEFATFERCRGCRSWALCDGIVTMEKRIANMGEMGISILILMMKYESGKALFRRHRVKRVPVAR
jgi:hypothetical protein